MWMAALDRGLQWLLVFAQGDPFERFIPKPETTSRVEVGAVFMVLSLVAAAAAILAKILL